MTFASHPLDLQIRHAIDPGDIPPLIDLWVQLGWGKPGDTTPDLVRQALAGSTWVAVAKLDGRFAGYARALSDGCIVTYLAEVAVVPALRRRGVGGALVESCLHAFRHTAIYADAAPDTVEFTRRHGLMPRPSYLTACARGPQPIHEVA
jgi:GNAT superfamily N-acetyltransferase